MFCFKLKLRLPLAHSLIKLVTLSLCIHMCAYVHVYVCVQHYCVLTANKDTCSQGSGKETGYQHHSHANGHFLTPFAT